MGGLPFLTPNDSLSAQSTHMMTLLVIGQKLDLTLVPMGMRGLIPLY